MIEIIKNGTDVKPKYGNLVTVHYTGTLLDGTKFDSSVDRGQPFSFLLGTGSVIKCWDEGVAQLGIGTKAILTCPPSLAYGKRGAGNNVIPPNSTLKFVIELLSFK